MARQHTTSSPATAKMLPLRIRLVNILLRNRYRFTRALAAKVIIGLSVGITGVACFEVARAKSVAVPIYHLDGAFQTLSSLERYSNGDVPGRDFFPYLGIGPTLAIFPAFLATGGSIASSVTATYLTLYVCVTVAVMVISMTLSTRRSLSRHLLVAALLISILVFLECTGTLKTLIETLPPIGIYALEQVVAPGASLRPMRAFAPYACAAIVLLLMPRGRHSGLLRVAITSAILGGFCAVWSPDYGAISAVLFGSYAIAMYWMQNRTRLNLFCAFAVGCSSLLAGSVALGEVLTRGHYAAYLGYFYIDVRNDQYWYFTPWREDLRILSAWDVFDAILNDQAIVGVVGLLFFFLALIFKPRSREYPLLLIIGFSAFASAALSSWGGHIGGYFWSVNAWFFLTVLVITCRSVLDHAHQVFTRTPRRRPAFGTPSLRTASAVLLVGFGALIAAENALRDQTKALSADPQYAYSAKMGGYIPRSFLPLTTSARQLTRGSVVEEYFGLTSAIVGPNSSFRVDSVIHALGRQRASFEAGMNSHPPLVISTSPGMDPMWVSWNLSQNWWFYSELFESYAPTQSSPFTLTWTKAKAMLWQDTDCNVGSGGEAVEINGKRFELLELRISYTSLLTRHRFSLIENNIQAVDVPGYLALDPHASTQRFPAVLLHDGDNVLRLKNPSDDNHNAASTIITKCSARVMRGQKLNAIRLAFDGILSPSQAPLDLTDTNWLHGVARRFPGIVIPNTSINRSVVSQGIPIYFKMGIVRKVTSVEFDRQYIRLNLDGTVPASTFPATFRLPLGRKFRTSPRTVPSTHGIEQNF
jgi:hypothetical protein